MKAAQEAARAASPEMVEALIGIVRQSGDDKARIAAANSVLDRALGKPVQAITGAEGGPIEVATVDVSKMSTHDLAALVEIASRAPAGTGDGEGGEGGTSPP